MSAALVPIEPPAAAAPDPDALFRGFIERAAGLAAGSIGGADALIADVVVSDLPDATFKPLAAAIGKATGLDADAMRRQMVKARAARDGAVAPGAGGNGGLAPAAQPAALARVASAVEATVKRQVWCTEADRTAVVLWIVGTHGYQAADLFPRLAITSETRRCGKSTLLTVVYNLAFAAELADNISPAAMFRIIAARPLTLCIDEFDSFGRDDSGLRNVLNAGYVRTGAVKRVEQTPDGKSWVVTDFPCFCPIAIAGIGGQPETVSDRSIVSRLQRAPKDRAGGRRMRFRELVRCREQIVPHLLAHADTIAAAMQQGAAQLPPSLHDRAADNWDPLIAVADLAGGEWPARAYAAAVALSGEPDASGLVEKLLEDIRFIVESPRRHAIEQWREWRAVGRAGARPPRLLHAQRPTEIRTEDLLGRLLSMADRPWQECNRGHPMTGRWLADRLRGLGVKPGRGRVPEWGFDANGEPLQRWLGIAPKQNGQMPRLRTYAVDELRAAWRRYL